MPSPNPSQPLPTVFPQAPLLALDTLWFQVAGTLCNLTCRHCFISCSPTNHAHEMLSLATVTDYLQQAEALGVKEYYFTGGEPFMNKDMMAILATTLKQGPASVLTNGVLITPRLAFELKALADASEYSLDLRISIDGYDAPSNDAVRGEGTWERILKGIRHLAEAGLVPVITVTEACEGATSQAGREKFLARLAEWGLRHPRLKIMPLLRLGAETGRTRSYAAWETLAGQALSAEDSVALQCASGRMVTSRGVYVCPILIDSPEARMGEKLMDGLRPFELKHQACYSCHAEGLSCRT